MHVQDWPSSTRVELAAIGTALLVLPQNCKISIYTNSANAISLIKKVRFNQKKSKISKLKNGSILALITDLIEYKELNVEFVKVKGHNRVYFNEQADKLVKLGCRGEKFVHWNIDWSRMVKVVPRWKRHIIDVPIRGLVDSITNMYYSLEWLQSSSIDELVNKNNRDIEIDWRETWRNIKKNAGAKCRSMKNSREWVFDTKCLNNLLLTLSILHKRNPILYSSATCIACRQEVEDLNYLAGYEIYEIF